MTAHTLARRLAVVALATALAAGSPASSAQRDTEFNTENHAAMDRMMTGMAINPTGDVDRDFAELMIPHHEGAIDMAMAELRHGKNEQLRRIAQEIIVDQQQEIAAMRLALGDPLPASWPVPTQAAPPTKVSMPMIPEHAR